MLKRLAFKEALTETMMTTNFVLGSCLLLVGLFLLYICIALFFGVLYLIAQLHYLLIVILISIPFMYVIYKVGKNYVQQRSIQKVKNLIQK